MLIPYADFKHAVPQPGQQVRINHDACPAGADRRARLYVKNDGSATMAYCHNCGGHAVRRTHGTKTRHVDLIKKLLAREEAAAVLTDEVELPGDTTLQPHQFSDKAKAWLYGYNLTDKDIQDYSIGYSPSWGRVILPVYEDGKLIFWQGRRVDSDSGEKYISVRSAKKPLFTAMPTDTSALWNGTMIVEDMLSAIRCAMFGWPALALLGTSEPDDIVARLPQGPNSCVWLDDDEAGRRKSAPLIERLKLIGKGVVYRPSGNQPQPKNLSPEELKEVGFDDV